METIKNFLLACFETLKIGAESNMVNIVGIFVLYVMWKFFHVKNKTNPIVSLLGMPVFILFVYLALIVLLPNTDSYLLVKKSLKESFWVFPSIIFLNVFFGEYITYRKQIANERLREVVLSAKNGRQKFQDEDLSSIVKVGDISIKRLQRMLFVVSSWYGLLFCFKDVLFRYPGFYETFSFFLWFVIFYGNNFDKTIEGRKILFQGYFWDSLIHVPFVLYSEFALWFDPVTIARAKQKIKNEQELVLGKLELMFSKGQIKLGTPEFLELLAQRETVKELLAEHEICLKNIENFNAKNREFMPMGVLLSLLIPFAFVLILFLKITEFSSGGVKIIALVVFLYVLYLDVIKKISGEKKEGVLVPWTIIQIVLARDLNAYKKAIMGSAGKTHQAWAKEQIKKTEETLKDARLL